MVCVSDLPWGLRGSFVVDAAVVFLGVVRRGRGHHCGKYRIRWMPVPRRVISANSTPRCDPAVTEAATLEPAAFVCVGETCSLPVADPAQIAATVEAMRQ